MPGQTVENFANKSVEIIRLRNDKITPCQRMCHTKKLRTNAGLMRVPRLTVMHDFRNVATKMPS